MISSLSKYFYKDSETEHPEETTSESNEEQKALNLENIRTTNFLRKLRKIDSTENILNLVQITEYKKASKKESGKSKKKLSLNVNTDALAKDTDDTSKSSSPNNETRSQHSLSRKEKRESINLLSTEDRSSSYESVVSEKATAPKSIGKINTFVIKRDPVGKSSDHHLSCDEVKETLLEAKEELLLKSSKSRIDLKNSNSRVVINNSPEFTSKTELTKTESGMKLNKRTVSNSFFEIKPAQESTVNHVSPFQSDKSRMDGLEKTSSRLSLGKKSVESSTVKKSTSEQRMSAWDSSYTQNEMMTPYLLSSQQSAEQFVNQVNLQGSDSETPVDTDGVDNEETSVLFTRKVCSNDSFYSKSYENSKIPVLLTRLDHGISHTMEPKIGEPSDHCIQDKEATSQDVPIIKTEISYSSKCAGENENDIGRISTFITRKSIPTFVETFGNAVKLNPSMENIGKITRTVEQPSVIKQSTKQIPIKKDFPKQTKAKSIKSKLSIFNSGIQNEKSLKSSFPIYQKKKALNTKDTMSRTPLILANHSTYKSNVSSVIQTKQQGYFQKSKTISQKSRTNSSFYSKSERSDSHKTLKMKSATPKKIQIDKTSDYKTTLQRKISCARKKSAIETTNEKESEENKINNEVIKCRDLKKEIMEKIEIYEQSVKKVYEIKNGMISKPEGSIIENPLPESFPNDETVNMISQVNAVEHIKLKDKCLTEPNGYVNNATDQVKEKLQNYYEYVQEKINELHEKRNTAGKTHDGRTNHMEAIIEDTRHQLELKSQEITEVVSCALGNMAVENQSLNRYCKDLIKTNDECNEKLMEKLVWLEKENENLSTQIFTLKRGSSNKILLDDIMVAKKKDDQVNEILKMYNEIEMKNNYHAQLVENFMKSVKMIESKIENHNRLVEVKVEKTTSQMDIAEKKRQALEETIKQLKQRLEMNQKDYKELTSKLTDFQNHVIKLKNKNKSLTKELLRYKYPVHLEKNIQKMISLRNMLVDIVHNSENPLPYQDEQLLDIMQSIDRDVFFPMLDPPSRFNNGIKETTTVNSSEVPKRDTNETEPSSPLIRDHGESMSNVQLSFDAISSVGLDNNFEYNIFG